MSEQPAQEAQSNEGPRKRNALDEFKLRLVGTPLQGAQKPPMLAVLSISNQVRLRGSSGTNDEGGRGWMLEAKMDAVTAFTVFAGIRQVVANKEITKEAIACKTGRDPIVLESTIVYGRDTTGQVFIGLMSADGQRKLQFVFRPTEYHSLSKADGSPVDPVYLSERWALAWVTLMEKLTAATLAVSYTDRLPASDDKPAGQGASSGGYQQRQGGYQPRPGGGGGGNWKDRQGGGGGGWKGNGGGGGGYQQRSGGGGGGGNWRGNNGGGGGNWKDRQGGGQGGGWKDRGNQGGGDYRPSQPEPEGFDEGTPF